MTTQQQVKEKVKQISFRVIIMLLLFAVLLTGFIFLTHHVLLEGEKELDKAAHEIVHQYRSPQVTPIVEFFTFFGSTPFLLPAYILLVSFYMFFKRNTKRSWNIIAIGLSSAAILHLMKNLIRRPRPESPITDNFHGFSYPSGHSFSIFIFCGILLYILWQSDLHKRWKWLTAVTIFIFAIAVAFSRVYLNVHYASDVIAGFMLSIIWLMASLYVLEKWEINKLFKKKFR